MRTPTRSWERAGGLRVTAVMSRSLVTRDRWRFGGKRQFATAEKIAPVPPNYRVGSAV